MRKVYLIEFNCCKWWFCGVPRLDVRDARICRVERTGGIRHGGTVFCMSAIVYALEFHVRVNRHDASGVRITHVNAPEVTSKHTSYHHEWSTSFTLQVASEEFDSLWSYQAYCKAHWRRDWCHQPQHVEYFEADIPIHQRFKAIKLSIPGDVSSQRFAGSTFRVAASCIQSSCPLVRKSFDGKFVCQVH